MRQNCDDGHGTSIGVWHILRSWREEMTKKPVPLESLRRLAAAGEQAGLTFEDMLLLLRSGVAIDKLLALIESGLAKAQSHERPS